VRIIQKAKGKRQKYNSKLKILLLLSFVLNFYIFTPAFSFIAHARSGASSFARAEKLFLEGRYDSAIFETEALIEARSSQRDEIYYLKGLSELKLKRFKDTRQSFDYIRERYPSSKRVFDAYLGTGDAYLLEGDAGKALGVYNEMTNRFSGDRNIAVVYSRLGDCYTRLGLREKAEEYFDKAKKASPSSFEVKVGPTAENVPVFSRPAQPAAMSGPKPKTEEMPRLESGEPISVQVGCFKYKRNAEKLSQRLVKAGYDSYVEIPVTSHDKLYRVKVGHAKSKDEAEALAARLKKAGYNTKICTAE